MENITQPVQKESKLSKLIYALIYIVLIIGICITSGLLFHKYYFTTFYIDGQSMYPTLNRSGTETADAPRKDFGIVDTHPNTINAIKRFDIITTYYKDDYDQYGELLSGANHEQKIKRVIGLPGDTIQTLARSIYIDGTELEIPYIPGSGTLSLSGPTVLAEDQYFVIGDNWGRSLDSTKTSVGPIQKSMIVGVLIAIEGTCILHKEAIDIYADDFSYSWPTFYKQ
ncbi:MAG: signal peptidase I [Erysipelotrichaceae bacterium]|nr:signal peptidase I [Erysipelotrichaceae bacterium]